LLNFELEFLEGFDPFFHFKQVQLLRSGTVEGFFTSESEKDKAINDVLNKKIHDKTEECRLISYRFIRFHSADTMLALLCSGFPSINTLEFTAKFRNSEYNEIVQSIANMIVPPILKGDNTDSFQDWIKYKILGKYAEKFELDDTVISMISSEAKIFLHKDSYNAFKHGFAVGKGGMTIESEDKTIKVGAHGASWMKYTNKSLSEFSFGTMDLDGETDIQAITCHSLLNNLMRDVRLIHITGQNRDIQIPSKLNKIRPYNVVTLRLNR